VPHRSHVISLMLVAERDTDDVNCHVDVGLLSEHPSLPPLDQRLGDVPVLVWRL